MVDGQWGLWQEVWARPGSGSQGRPSLSWGPGVDPETLSHWILPLDPLHVGLCTCSSAQRWGLFKLSCAGWVPGVATLPGPLPREGNVCLLGPCATGPSVVPPLRGCSMTRAPGQGRWVPGLSPGISVGLQWGPWPCKAHRGKSHGPERLCNLPEVTQQ